LYVTIGRYVKAWLIASLLACGCTAIDGWAFRFADGGGPSDLSGATDLAGIDGAFDLGDVDGLAGRCGSHGQPCCPLTPQCFGGGCCVGGLRCWASGTAPGGVDAICYDGNTVGCGQAGQPCCEGDTCKSNGCCVGGRCSAMSTLGGCGSSGSCGTSSCSLGAAGACGGGAQACCKGSVSGGGVADFCVASGLACTRDTHQCLACGQQGQQCCDGSVCADGCCDQSAPGRPTCIAPGGACGNGQGLCVAGGCKGGICGRIGDPCCGSNVACTAPYSTCSSGTCQPCGGLDQACCAGAGGGLWCSEPFVCDGPKCVRCGSAGAPCCAGDRCFGSVCNSGTCT
jgi:hypothetical protein